MISDGTLGPRGTNSPPIRTPGRGRSAESIDFALQLVVFQEGLPVTALFSG